MQDVNERREDALVDLGTVETETKGGIVGFLDTAGSEQPGMGLADD